MKLNFRKVLEVVFPLSDDERNIALCTRESFLKKLQPHRTDEILALSHFSDERVRSAIHLAKFHYNSKALYLLSEMLACWIASIENKQYQLIPIPLSSERMNERGHNQVESVARKAVSGLPNVELCTRILKKTRHTQPQTSLDKKARKKNLDGAFSLDQKHAEKIRGQHILLLDDVTTTGTTLLHARKALMEYEPQSVACVALAH